MIWDSRLVPIWLLESGQTPEQTHPVSGLASSGLGAAGAWLRISPAGTRLMPRQRGWQWRLPHRGLGAKRFPASGAGGREPGRWALRTGGYLDAVVGKDITSPLRPPYPYLQDGIIIAPASEACQDYVHRVILSGSPDLYLLPLFASSPSFQTLQ